MKVKVESVFEDASAYEFINSTGEISRDLYLAKHPEETEEVLRPAVVRKPKVSTSFGQVAA